MIPLHPSLAAMRSNELRKEKTKIRKENPRNVVELNLSLLLDTMAEYMNDHPSIFIQEKNLKESILKTIPAPSNLQEVRQIDTLWTERECGKGGGDKS